MKQSPLKKELLYLHSAAGNTNKPDQRQRLYFLCDIIHIFIRKCNCDYFSTREILSPHSRDFVPAIFLKATLQACFMWYQKAVSSIRIIRTVPASRPPLQTGAALPIIDLRTTPKKPLKKKIKGGRYSLFSRVSDRDRS